MEEEKQIDIKDDDTPEFITPWYIITMLKPIIKDEIIAQFRYDRTGIKMRFCNGQKFHLTVTEIK